MKAHQFQSITEEQWKSGLSRHKCALCAYDYDDPVHGFSAAEYPDESCGLVMKFVAECAREHWSVN